MYLLEHLHRISGWVSCNNRPKQNINFLVNTKAKKSLNPHGCIKFPKTWYSTPPPFYFILDLLPQISILFLPWYSSSTDLINFPPRGWRIRNFTRPCQVAIKKPDLDREGEYKVGQHGYGGLDHVGEQGGEREAVRHIPSTPVTVHLHNQSVAWSISHLINQSFNQSVI